MLNLRVGKKVMMAQHELHV